MNRDAIWIREFLAWSYIWPETWCWMRDHDPEHRQMELAL